MKTSEMTLETALNKHRATARQPEIVDYFYAHNTTIVMYTYRQCEVLHLSVPSHELESRLQYLEEALPTYDEVIDLPHDRTETIKLPDWEKFFKDQTNTIYVQVAFSEYLEDNL